MHKSHEQGLRTQRAGGATGAASLRGARLAGILAAGLMLCAGQAGCASIVLGPGNPAGPEDAVFAALLSQRPVDPGHGPEATSGATEQWNAARTLEQALAKGRFGVARDRRVRIRALLPGGPPGGEEARPAATALLDYVTARTAERLVEAGARVVPGDARADFDLFAFVEGDGGVTTERVYRVQGYPVYYHYEDHRRAVIRLLLVESATGRTTDLGTGQQRRIAVDSYFLDVFGVRFRF